jgi:hypothetical protein
VVKKSANPAAQANFRAEVFREYRVNAHASGPGGGGGAHHTQGPGGTRGGSSAAGSFCIALGLLIDVLNVFAALDGEAELSLRWPDHDGRLAGNITGLLRHSREVLDWLLRVLVVHEPCRLSSVECVLTHDNNVVKGANPSREADEYSELMWIPPHPGGWCSPRTRSGARPTARCAAARTQPWRRRSAPPPGPAAAEAGAAGRRSFCFVGRKTRSWWRRAL